MKNDDTNHTDDFVALIPAAGEATRFGHLPCSKELLPIGFQHDASLSKFKPKVLMSCVIDLLREASVKRIYIILRKGKWDIPMYFGDGSKHGVNIGYLIQNLPYGVPFTLDQAFPFIRSCNVVLGFADTIYRNSDTFTKLLKGLKPEHPHVVLGLFPADEAGNADRVHIGSRGIIEKIVCKPEKSNSQHVWATAVWRPEFTTFLHGYLNNLDASALHSEVQIGQVIQAAIQAGFTVEGVEVSNQPPFDVGNADSLRLLWEDAKKSERHK